MENILTKQQLTTIGTICSNLKIAGDDKEAMVSGFTAGREVSSKYMTFDEAKAMIAHLLKLQGVHQIPKPGDAMRNKIFYYCHEIGWTKASKKTGKKVADGKRFDEWAVKFSYLKKKLNQYSYAELPKLVSQFEAVYKSFLNKF